MCICYVDDLILWLKDNVHIHELAIMLCHSGVDFRHEDNAAGFLTIMIEWNNSGLMEIKQEGSLGLNIGILNGEATTDKDKLLM